MKKEISALFNLGIIVKKERDIFDKSKYKAFIVKKTVSLAIAIYKIKYPNILGHIR